MIVAYQVQPGNIQLRQGVEAIIIQLALFNHVREVKVLIHLPEAVLHPLVEAVFVLAAEVVAVPVVEAVDTVIEAVAEVVDKFDI